MVAHAHLAGQVTGKTRKEIGRLCCHDMIFPGNMLIHKESVIWQGQELVQTFLYL